MLNKATRGFRVIKYTAGHGINMKKLCIAILIASVPVCSPTFAADLPRDPPVFTDESIFMLDGWYAEASAGVGFGEAELEDEETGFDLSENEIGFTGRVAVGKAVTNNIRIGIEGSYAMYTASFDDADIDVDIWSIMAAAYYDFRNYTRFTPYIGAGAGLGIMSVEESGGIFGLNVSSSETSTHPAFKVAAGVSVDINDGLQIFTDYNFIYLPEAELFDEVDVNSQQHTINLGLRYFF